MLDSTSKVLLTLIEGGSHLVRKGSYRSAKINVINGFTDNETIVTLSPFETIKEPTFSHSRRIVNIGNEFVTMALTKPKMPKKRNEHNKQLWDLVSRWNKISDEDKIEFACEKYAQDMGCELESFEIL